MELVKKQLKQSYQVGKDHYFFSQQLNKLKHWYFI